MPKLSIVIPVFNERDTVLKVVDAVENCGLEDYELLIVDDSSTDGTVELLKGDGIKPCHVVRFHERNMGKGAALRTGVKHAVGDYIVFQDADLEYDPRDLVTMLKVIESGEVDVVYGSRLLHPGIKDISPFWHRFINRFLSEVSNFFTGLRLTDMETCYKMFPRSALSRIEFEEKRFGIEPELTAKVADLGLTFKEVPISYNRRSFEEGKKIGAIDGFRAIYVIAKYGLKFV